MEKFNISTPKQLRHVCLIFHVLCTYSKDSF